MLPIDNVNRQLCKRMSKRRLKDVDAAERLYRIKALSWGLSIGFLGGGGAGAALAALLGGSLLVGALIGFAATAPFIYLVSTWVMERAGSVAQTIYHPSGESTPHKREYSYAESLVARARYEEAVAAYELYCTEYPEDPEPYFRLARLLRDHLEAFEDAVSWFQRGRADAQLVGAQELVATQEIIDIYIHKLRAPRRAIPELKLLCERFPETPAALAAERELTEMREMLARERDGLEPFTEQYLGRVDRTAESEGVAEERTEQEKQRIQDALRENGGDLQGTALRLGVRVDELQKKMRELGI